jgi:hypothetical protein
MNQNAGRRRPLTILHLRYDYAASTSTGEMQTRSHYGEDSQAFAIADDLLSA